MFVVVPPRITRAYSRDWWFKEKPQEWLRPFTKDAETAASVALSLRGRIVEIKEDAVKARQEGDKEAQKIWDNVGSIQIEFDDHSNSEA